MTLPPHRRESVDHALDAVKLENEVGRVPSPARVPVNELVTFLLLHFTSTAPLPRPEQPAKNEVLNHRQYVILALLFTEFFLFVLQSLLKTIKIHLILKIVSFLNRIKLGYQFISHRFPNIFRRKIESC